MALDDDDIQKITALLAGGLKPVLDRLEKVEKVEQPDVAALVAEAMKAAKPDDKADDKADTEAIARMAALEAKLAEEKTARETAEAARASEKMLGALRTQLLAANVPAARVDHAIAHLHHSQKRLSLDDSGAPQLRFDRTSAGGSYQDQIPLADGLTEWLGSDDGKAFLPAAKVQGVRQERQAPQFQTTGQDGKPKLNASALVGQLLNRAARGG